MAPAREKHSGEPPPPYRLLSARLGAPGIPQYSARERLRRLLGHRYSQQFRRHVGADGVWFELTAATPQGKTRKCTGLIGRARRAFYPTYNRRSAVRLNSAARRMQGAGRGRRTGERSSVAGGKRLDAELLHIVNCLGGDPRAQLATGQRCECGPRPPRRSRCAQSGEMLWNPQVMRYLEECRGRDITLLRSQVTVGSPLKRLCTDIDDVGVQYEGTPRERLVFLERKRGYADDSLFASCGYLEPPFPQSDGTKSSAFNHHQLQVCLGQQIVNQEYAAAGVRVDHTYVVYLSRHTKDPDPVKRNACEWYGPRGWWHHEDDRRLLYAKLCRGR